MMVVRAGGITLACLVGLAGVGFAGQVAAQERDPYPQPFYAEPNSDELPPGYYRRRYFRRLPPGHDEDEVVVIERRRVHSGVGVSPQPPFVRHDYRVVPGPYADDPLPRRYFRRAEPASVDPDDGRALPEGGGRDRYAALPRQEPRVSSPPYASPPLAARPDRADGPSSAAELPARLRRQVVNDPTGQPAGTIVVDTRNTYLYYVLGNGRAMRYGIGVGREGFTWSGRERISRKAEWPDWYPPKDMLERQPYLPRMMAGGPGNPLGARALYLGNTLYRIHGTSDVSSIGRYVSSGCIRMLNEDIKDLYERVKVGARVVVLRGRRPPAEATARR